MQGYRGDTVICDDVESMKNAMTVTQREQLSHRMKDMPSICVGETILYLGTPQTSESVYNDLPGQGFEVRIWPGRYPTKKEEDNYGDMLAPLLTQRMTDTPSLRTGGGVLGERGKAVDTMLPQVSEAELCRKEMVQGASYFQLQHMLDTKLSDENRFPLKLKNLIVMDLDKEVCPATVTWMPDPRRRITYPGMQSSHEFYLPHTVSEEMNSYAGCVMFVDTAGKCEGGDETTYCVTKAFRGNVFIMDVGGCLLYTSPSPRDRTRSRMPSSA